MTQLACWVLFPSVLVILSLGCGLLLERVSGLRLAGPLVIPAGLAVLIDAAELMTKLSPTARFTAPAVVALALVGFAVGRPQQLRARFGPWPLVAAVAVYLVYLAPVLATGEPTFTGYIKLDDTSTWMAMIDRVLGHGHDLSGLAPSTYETTLHFYLNNGDPVGAMLPWGIGHQLVGQDVAWVFQPYLALLGAMLALSLWPLAARLVRSPRLRALVVFIAAQSALIYGYSLWGGIKEVAATSMLPLVVACAVPVFERRARLRSFLPLAAACFGMLSVLAFGGAVWLAVVLVVVSLFALNIWVRSASRVRLVGLLAAVVLVAVGLIRGGQSFVEANGALTGGQLGNLLHPLNGFQLFGIWPVADFRIDPPDAASLTYVLIAVVIAAGSVGLLAAWRRRSWVLWLYLVSGVVGVGLVSAKGSPWVQGKALATASPAALFAGLVGAVMVVELPLRTLPGERGRRGALIAISRRAIGLLAAIAVCGGVLWSNVVAYHHVTLAPYAQFRELQHIGDRFAGQGPTLLNEYQPYGARHFLRSMDPESPSELRRRTIPLLGGGLLPKAGYADLDQFELPGLLVYRTIVTRTSPVASRPPAPYRLVYAGRWYQVWQRPLAGARPVLGAIPLGNSVQPTAAPACGAVLRLARSTPAGGVLAAVSRTEPQVVSVPSPLPTGDIAAAFALTRPGLYQVWLGGSFFRRLTTSVDGVRIGSSYEQLNEAGEWTPLGTVRLGTSAHRVTLSYGDAALYPGGGGPGSAGPFFPVGPLALAPLESRLPITYVQPSAARSLCGKAWDWIEALGR
jgi:hypothetical protein